MQFFAIIILINISPSEMDNYEKFYYQSSTFWKNYYIVLWRNITIFLLYVKTKSLRYVVFHTTTARLYILCTHTYANTQETVNNVLNN